METSGQQPVDPSLSAAAVLNWAAVSGAGHQPVSEIATIGDRKVRVAGGSVALAAAQGTEPSLYNLTRQWVQNNPDNILPPPIDDHPSMPPVPKLDGAPPKAPFDGSLVISDAEDPTSLEAHKQRWKAAAAHMKQTGINIRQPYVRRLISVMPAVPGGGVGGEM